MKCNSTISYEDGITKLGISIVHWYNANAIFLAALCNRFSFPKEAFKMVPNRFWVQLYGTLHDW
jgi:hypothetical protein